MVSKELQEQILSDYNKLVADGLASVTSIRHKLASQYALAYSTIHKITTYGYKTPVKDLNIELPYRTPSVKTVNVTYPKTYIFLGWEIRVETSKFLSIIDQLKERHNAEVFLTCLWPADVAYLPEELQKYTLLLNDLELNDNLIFKYVPTHALAMTPIQGWDGASEKSVILPGLVKEVKTALTDKYCKQIMTTGSLGCLTAHFSNYNHIKDSDSRIELTKRWSRVNSQNRRGGRSYEIARNYTKPTALIVDILDNTTFLSRYVTMESNVVYDLDTKYYPNKPPTKSKPSALVVGDLHAYGVDETKLAATKRIIEQLQPESVVIQDVFDGASVNHHEIADFANVVKFPSLQEEADITESVIKDICNISNKVYYLHSNHDDFLTKYLSNENNYKLKDNYIKALELRMWQVQNDRHPIIKLLNLDNYKNLEFVSVFDNLYIKGVLVKHGHEGLAGRRVGFRVLVKIHNKYIQGHTHSAEIYRNGLNVGTTSKLKMGYNYGASAWVHTDGIIQPDGSLQAINVIDGRWHKEYE